MASPNACGCISLLVSGCKAQSIPYSPYLIKNAVISSGLDIGDELNVPFIQVADAWEYLQSLPNVFMHFYAAEVNGNRGLRLAAQDKKQYSCTITPRVFKSKTLVGTGLDLDVQVVLECKAAWVAVPKYLLLNNSPRSFSVIVDPSKLVPGFHFTTIDLVECTSGKVLSRIPITVTKPIPLKPAKLVENGGKTSVNIQGVVTSSEIQRYFYSVPSNVNYARVKVTKGLEGILLVYFTQRTPQSRYDAHTVCSFLTHQAWYTVREDIDNYFLLVPGVDLEVTIVCLV